MAKVIMIQGTMSGAGKSLLAAGLCRIFREDGLKVAPFKSQNMALNSYITKDGLEMGRAQVVQAEAAGIEPSVYMNPILLKPTNDVGSQVIVNGEVLGNMGARDYFAYKKQLVPHILKAYEKLSQAFDVIVVEGAGSPAEINLKENDIVNMGLAKMLKSPVLLAGDIDRGGVFAQLFGTVELLDKEERSYVKGMIINKFRGDKAILDPGIFMLEERTKIPVVGTVPMLRADIEEEDSLSNRLEQKKKESQAGEMPGLDIAVVRFPRISNYTDLAPLEASAGVQVRYVSLEKDLGYPDLIVLPGSKNTMSDLRWLRTSGMEAGILKRAEKGCPLFGICGGYQMMGESLSDPEGAEGGGFMRGMGLLPMATVFKGQKTRTRIRGNISQVQGCFAGLSGAEYEGYEIHMGESYLTEEDRGRHVLCKQEGRLLGVCKDTAAGTYIHGIFDTPSMTEGLLRLLAEQKGLDANAISGVDFKAYKEQQYQQLASGIRKSLDMDAVYRMLEEGLSYEGALHGSL